MAIANKFAFILRQGMGVKAKNGKLSMPIIDDDEWMQVMLLGKEQTVMGILERGVQQVSSDCRPPRSILLKLCVVSQKIATMNRMCDEAAVKLGALLEKEGFKYCILKGQGNALMYNDPSARMPGDIDVWVAALPKQVISFARKDRHDAFACYHHVEYNKCDGVEVELHYRPAFLNNPIHNSRLQRWFASEADTQCTHRVDLPNGVGTVNVPTDGFNRIFLMAHMMNHMIHDGLGIRQLMDYYFLMRRGFTPEEQQRDVELLKQFGLYNMTAAVMFALRKFFGMPLDKMLVPPDERRGRFLMKEVLEGGNFGRFSAESKGAHTKIQRNILRLKRDFRLLTMFPSECCSEPMFRLWHYFWRLNYK